MARAIRQERPPARIYELSTAPVLNKTAEAIRKDMGAYVDYMGKANRKPEHVHLRPEQYDSLSRAFAARLDKLAPPPVRTDFQRHSGGSTHARAGA